MSVTLVGSVGHSSSSTGTFNGAYGQTPTAGSLLVAVVNSGGTTSAGAFTVTTPSGWTASVIRGNTASNNRAGVASFWKIAAGSDSVPSFVTNSSGTIQNSAYIYELSGSDTSSPIAVTGNFGSEGGGAATTTASISVTSASVPNAGSFSIAGFCRSQSSVGTATMADTSTPSRTKLADDGAVSQRNHGTSSYVANPTSGSTNTASISITSATAQSAAIILIIAPSSNVDAAITASPVNGTTTIPSATVASSGNASTSPGVVNGVATIPAPVPSGDPGQLRSVAAYTTGAGSLTLSIPVPPVQVGDLIAIWAVAGFDALTWTEDTSTFTVETAVHLTSPGNSAQLFHKIADSSDVALANASGSYTLTVSLSHTWNAAIVVAPAANLAHPFDPSDSPGSGQTNGTSTSVDAASITTTTNNDILVWLGANGIGSGGTPPAMTQPSGYTVEAAQVNGSGAGTVNTGLMVASKVQSSAGSTGTVSGSFTGAQRNVGLLLAIRAAPVVPIAGTVSHMISGAPDDQGFTVISKLSEATSVRLKVATDSGLTTNVQYIGAETPDSNGYVTHVASGLDPFTRYYFGLADTPSGGSETLLTPNGSCKTLPTPGTATDFTATLGSCMAEQDTTVPPALNLAVDDWTDYNADVNVQVGDFDYSGTTSTDLDTQIGVYESQINTIPGLKTQIANAWGFYCRSDHEAGSDNGDSDNDYTATNIAAAQAVFPMAPLGDTINTPVHGLYQSWVVGRVRFIMVDIRNVERSPGSNTDDGSKTMLGADQLAWLKDQLVESEPLKVIVSDVGWMGAASISNGPDKWWSYDTERQDIIDYITANRAAVKGVMLWHGDTHCVGVATATKNTWGNFPVYCGSPTINVGGGRNLTAFSDYYNNSAGECRQYGRVAFTDDGSTITVTFDGWDAVTGTAQVTQTDTFQSTDIVASPVNGSTTIATPTVSGRVSISPSAVAGVSTIATPSFSMGTTVSAVAVNGTSTIATPTVSSSTGITSVAVDGTSSIVAPSVSTSVLIAASPVDGVTTIAQPAAHGGIVKVLTVVSGTTTLPAPDVSTGDLVSANAVNSSSSVPSPSISAGGGTTISANAVSGSTTIVSPGVSVGSDVAANAVDGNSSIASPTVFVNSNADVSADAVDGIATIATPAVSVNSNVDISATAVDGIASIASPTIQTQGNASVSANAVDGAAVIASPAISTAHLVGVTAVDGTSTIATPDISTQGNANAHAVLVSGTSTISQPVVSGGGNVSANPVDGTTSVPAPAIVNSGVATANAVAGNTSIPQPTISAVQGASITANPVNGSVVIGAQAHSSKTASATAVSGSATIPTPVVETIISANAVNGTTTIPQASLITNSSIIANAVNGSTVIPEPLAGLVGVVHITCSAIRGTTTINAIKIDTGDIVRDNSPLYGVRSGGDEINKSKSYLTNPGGTIRSSGSEI